jgi:ketosteroid isomerase-like protein
VTEPLHERLLAGWADALARHDWDALAAVVQPDLVLEFPQSGERFVGFANVRAQFENYPDLEPGSTELEEIVGGTTYALTPSYTVIAVDGTGDRGTAVMRVRYPDQSMWWAVNLYDLRDGLIARSRTYFAPDFDPPDWRAPYRDAP